MAASREPEGGNPHDPQPPGDLGPALSELAAEFGPSGKQYVRRLCTVTDEQGVIADGESWLRAAAASAAAGELHARVVTGACDEGGLHVAVLFTPETFCRVSAWSQVHPGYG